MRLSNRFATVWKVMRTGCATIVLAALMTIVVPAIAPDGRAQAAAGDQVVANVAVNIRSGPGTSHRRLGVLYRGQSVTARGNASNGWVPVNWQGQQAWVSAAYVTQRAASAPDTPSPAPSTGSTTTMRTTVRLNVRSAPSLSGQILTVFPKNSPVHPTGQVSNGWTQITWSKRNVWVSSRYLTPLVSNAPSVPTPITGTPAPEPTPTPTTIGSRWGTVALNLWHSATSSSYAGEAAKGSEFHITGTVSNGRAEVVYRGAVRWVTAKYLTETAPNALPTSPQTCQASYYGSGHTTANGERYDPAGITAAHKSLPFGTKLKVTNVANGKSVTVRINDRGPYIAGRCLDLSTGAFSAIADLKAGVIKVSYEITN